MDVAMWLRDSSPAARTRLTGTPSGVTHVSTISVNDDPTIYDKDRTPTGGRTMHRGLSRLVRAAILPALVLCGCATVAPVRNSSPFGRVEPETGYRIAKSPGRQRGPANNPDALVFLAFSGGGTRAAALS